MYDFAFSSVLSGVESTASGLTAGAFLMCSLTSLVLGLAIALIFNFRSKLSKGFLVTLALLPLIVQVVITLVNGNIGAGVAVMGVFSLVRFRSIPGSAKDICAVFLAMAVGLAAGMGYLSLALALTVIVGIANFAYMLSPFGKEEKGKGVNAAERRLVVKIPEDLDYYGMFDDLFDAFTTDVSLETVRTTNMGSLYELTYLITLKDLSLEKTLLDGMRMRNGNLAIQCGRAIKPKERETL